MVESLGRIDREVNYCSPNVSFVKYFLKLYCSYKTTPPSAPAAQSKDGGQGLTFSSELLPGSHLGEASVGCGELSLLARLLGPAPLHGDTSQLHLDLFSSPVEEQ